MKIPPEVISQVLKFAFTNAGTVVRWMVGIFITWAVTKQHLIPPDGASGAERSLEDGLMALVPIGYGAAQIWLNTYRVSNNKKVQEALNTVLPDDQQLKTDGVIGHKTVNAVLSATQGAADTTVANST